MVDFKVRHVRGALGSFSILLVVLLSACSSKPTLYRWGSYEPLLYQMYLTKEGSDPASQVQILREDINRTQAEGHRVAPGVHAHLGFLYYSQGELAASREQFLKEKEQFPEAAVFIDGILKRMNRTNKHLGPA